MNITDVKVTIAPRNEERLKAFCTITFDDCFIIRDLKLIEGTSGLFVAMPSRKLTDHCPKCGSKNHLRARFCNDCGGALDERRGASVNARMKLHADTAHPINSECRSMIQDAVVEAFEREGARAEAPHEAAPLVSPEPDVEADTVPDVAVPDVEPDEDSGNSFGSGIL